MTSSRCADENPVYGECIGMMCVDVNGMGTIRFHWAVNASFCTPVNTTKHSLPPHCSLATCSC